MAPAPGAMPQIETASFMGSHCGRLARALSSQTDITSFVGPCKASTSPFVPGRLLWSACVATGCAWLQPFRSSSRVAAIASPVATPGAVTLAAAGIAAVGLVIIRRRWHCCITSSASSWQGEDGHAAARTKCQEPGARAAIVSPCAEQEDTPHPITQQEEVSLPVLGCYTINSIE